MLTEFFSLAQLVQKGGVSGDRAWEHSARGNRQLKRINSKQQFAVLIRTVRPTLCVILWIFIGSLDINFETFVCILPTLRSGMPSPFT